MFSKITFMYVPFQLFYFLHYGNSVAVDLTNSVAWVRERTLPTERPPLVGEVIANFCG
jgi:hypothetical protein